MISVESAKTSMRLVAVFPSLTLCAQKGLHPIISGLERASLGGTAHLGFQLYCARPSHESSYSLRINVLFIVFRVYLPPVKLNV